MIRPAHLALVALACLAPRAAHAQARPEPTEPAVLTLPDSAKWSACGGWKGGCEATVLYGDPATGPSHLLVRLTPSTVIPRMWHLSNEHFVVVSGRFVGKGEHGKNLVLGPGAHWYVPRGTLHGGIRCAGPEPCMFYESHDRALVTTMVGDSAAGAH